uniref:DNA-binding response regulator SrrA n=1 Tax=Acetithermum autotrophicum TaxID=1446466 RepID=H5SRK9_ACEAU|nr:DNA-binding response regulator SrrA [Candidatus Acetothermum autotrophicum]
MASKTSERKRYSHHWTFSFPHTGALGSLLAGRLPDLLVSEYNTTVHASILVVEDEEKLAQAIALYLRNAGFSVEIALDGQAALEAFARRPFDLIVLDLMLPKVDGWEVCHRIRRESDVPIIMLTARVGEPARVQGLELGADDYLEKPFNLRELVARIHAILRRAGKRSQSVIRAGDLRIDLEQHEVFVGNRRVELTASEFALLAFMAQHPNRVFTRLQLLDAMRGSTFETLERAVDSHIKNLRKKIERNPQEPEYIQTVYGVGYRFRSQSP